VSGGPGQEVFLHFDDVDLPEPGGITMRNLMLAVLAAVSATAGAVGLGGVASAAPTGPIALVVPQQSAFGFLGHSCGGIQEQVFATGFDPTTGFADAVAYLSTSCGGSGRGGGYHSTTYSAWIQASWDYLGTELSTSVLSSVPTVEPTLVADDQFGNELYNSKNQAYLQLASGFTPAPRVTGLSVSTGPATGGTTLTISGDGFTGATSVSFGGTSVVPVVTDDTSITVVTPAVGAGTVGVIVTTAGGESGAVPDDQFTFVAAPIITSISPTAGPLMGGTQITFTGSGFTGATEVSFGDTAVSPAVNSDTSMTVISPPGETAESVNLSVTTIGGTSPHTSATQFTYRAPVICSKLTGTVGGVITISKCTPARTSDKSASLDATGSLFTWSTSAQTTTVSPLVPTSPGQGSCPKGRTEYDFSGTVTGGTSTDTTVGDSIYGVTCASTSGALSLLKGSKFAL
jgi:hypothetical protein